jgi:uncharacterized protein YdbL (DUF1318 family)
MGNYWIRSVLCVLVAVFSVAIQPVSAQSAREELIQGFAQFHKNKAFQENLKRRGYTGAKYKIALDHNRRIFTDREIIGFLADTFLKVDLTRQGAGILPPEPWEAMFARGIGHLSATEMRRFISVELRVLNNASAANCGKYLKGRLAPDKRAVLRDEALTSYDAATLQAFFRAEYKVLKTGARRSPPPRVTRAQEARVNGLVGKNIAGYLNDAKSAGRIIKGMQNIEKASNKTACNVGKIWLGSVINVGGSDGKLAMRMFFEE